MLTPGQHGSIMGDKMQLVTNVNGDNHHSRLTHLFADAQFVLIAAAFLKSRGAHLISECVKQSAAKDAVIEIYVGTDFFLTEPVALDLLEKLQREYAGCRVRIARAAPATFHPKIYAAGKGGKIQCLIGSANLTGGALKTNEELSLLVDLSSTDAAWLAIEATFERYRNSDRFMDLDAIVAAQYALAHAVDQRQRKKYESARDAIPPIGMNLLQIARWYNEYLEDESASAELAERRRARKKAVKIQKRLASLADEPVTRRVRRDLREGLSNLIGAAGHNRLWSSGSIHRQGSKALDQEDDMIELFAMGQRVSAQSVEQGYESVRRKGAKIPGVGLNMATEMLCTFAPHRYAIYNGNTVAALAALGIEISKYASFASINPERYGKICRAVQALGTRIGTRDLAEVDAFLNWVYWGLKAGKLKH